jgi:hypothetical protein
MGGRDQEAVATLEVGYHTAQPGATILGDGRIGLLIDVTALKNCSPSNIVAWKAHAAGRATVSRSD